MRWLVAGVTAGAVLAIVVAGLGGTAEVSADNPPHKQGAGVTADSCAGCHRAHTAQAEELLKESQTSLCLSCHGASGQGSDLDVEDGKIRSGSGALKGGGFEYASIDTTDATPDAIGVLPTPEAVTSKHNVGATGIMWGNGGLNTGVGGTNDLECGSCHDPHGNGQYRILRPVPKNSNATTPVNVPDQATPVYTTTNFFDVTYVDNEKIASWCAQCHTRYLAGAGSEETSSGDSIFKYRHRSDGIDPPGAPPQSPPCIKCHASHGTNATLYADAGRPTPGFSAQVPWPGGTPVATPSSNSRLLKMDNRGICQKCHSR